MRNFPVQQNLPLLQERKAGNPAQIPSARFHSHSVSAGDRLLCFLDQITIIESRLVGADPYGRVTSKWHRAELTRHYRKTWDNMRITLSHIEQRESIYARFLVGHEVNLYLLESKAI